MTLKLARLPSGEPEIFASIQGEGLSLGEPSTFVRLALCNLECSWCDTKYTWDWMHYDPSVEIVQLSESEVVERVKILGVENVVVTGGEPLLQQDSLIGVLAELKGDGHRIEVETNGTLQPVPSLMKSVVQWNVSPKLSHSHVVEGRRIVGAPMDWFARSTCAWFKFVVEAPSDIDEVNRIVKRYDIPSQRVILMPQGTSHAELARRSPSIAKLCTLHGYRFSTRAHILLWGDVRGR
ncbi:MAG: 7-carboxy-7-deazaguanine synthase QueE [Chloroflexota bacterium]|nr:7-carboxy-7-deazaguanine synthase QueE [Chloroflexota bacterium]